MATRNLTKKFLEIRSGCKASKTLKMSVGGDDTDGSDSGLLNQAADSSNWKALKGSATLPPRWVEDIERIEENISKIKLKIRELGGLHTKRLMVNFETDEVQQERDIDFTTHEITELFHQSEVLLKKFSKLADQNAPSAEVAVRTNIQRSVAKRLQELSMSFRTTQKEYLSKLTTQKTEAGAVFDFELPATKTSALAEYDTGFNDNQLQILDDTEELVNQRDQEIAHIAKSIEELAQIFKELAVLVIDQGTILDRIDFNMESAVEHAREGIVQLEKAEEHQKGSIGFKCIILLCVLITIMLIILILKNTSFKK